MEGCLRPQVPVDGQACKTGGRESVTDSHQVLVARTYPGSARESVTARLARARRETCLEARLSPEGGKGSLPGTKAWCGTHSSLVWIAARESVPACLVPSLAATRALAACQACLSRLVAGRTGRAGRPGRHAGREVGRAGGETWLEARLSPVQAGRVGRRDGRPRTGGSHGGRQGGYRSRCRKPRHSRECTPAPTPNTPTPARCHPPHARASDARCARTLAPARCQPPHGGVSDTRWCQAVTQPHRCHTRSPHWGNSK